jgi:hypothetical protein
MGIPITLDIEDVMVAAQAGILRRCNRLKKGYKDKDGFNGDGWGIDIEGAAAEYAAAIVLGVPWRVSLTAFRDGDLGEIQVRSTKNTEGFLRLSDRDDDNKPYVLVTGEAPSFTVQGWIWAADGKNQFYYRKLKADRPPAFFVPIDDLLPIHELKALIISGEVQADAKSYVESQRASQKAA